MKFHQRCPGLSLLLFPCWWVEGKQARNISNEGALPLSLLTAAMLQHLHRRAMLQLHHHIGCWLPAAVQGDKQLRHIPGQDGAIR